MLLREGRREKRVLLFTSFWIVVIRVSSFFRGGREGEDEFGV